MADWFVLGLTGPTGAGKSTVAQELARQGGEIVDCDKLAREVTDSCRPCLQELCEAFGEDILDPSGALRRRVLAQRAFSGKEETERLNRITHPWILRLAAEQMAAAQKRGAAFAVLDAPVLYESGADASCDAVIAVLAPPALRLARIMQRDGIPEELARARMRAQQEPSFYGSRADFLIDGSAPPECLPEAVRAVLRAMAKGRGSV